MQSKAIMAAQSGCYAHFQEQVAAATLSVLSLSCAKRRLTDAIPRRAAYTDE